jgi:hypothetical protein
MTAETTDHGGIWTAVALAQSQIGTLAKSANNPFFSQGGRKAKYVPLDKLLEAIEQPLADNGLVLMQPPCVIYGPNGPEPGLRTILVHVPTSTELTTEMLLCAVKDYPTDKAKASLDKFPPFTNPQQQGSAITYARRFAIISLFCINCEDDDDGERAVGRGASPKVPTQVAPAESTATNPSAIDECSGEPFQTAAGGGPDSQGDDEAPVKPRKPSAKATATQLRNEEWTKLADQINEAETEAAGKPSRNQQNLLFALMRGKNYDTPDKQHKFYSDTVGRPVASYTELTREEIESILALLKVA